MTRQLWWMLSGLAAVGVASDAAHAQLTSVLFSENFDGLASSLGASVNERQGFPYVTRVATDANSEVLPNAFSHVGPAAWTVNNSLSSIGGVATVGNTGVPGQGVTDYGVDEWEGWSFADKSFWVNVTGDQDRGLFNNASGTVAVVDGDEYFDLGDANNAVNGGFFNSGLTTAPVPTPAGSIYTLSFASSWRPESFDDGHRDPAFNNLNNQAVEVVAVFDNGFRQTRLEWNSDPLSPLFKDDATNEALSFNFGVPAGATSVQFEFNYANAANDWWWAVDNLEVTNLSTGGTQVWAENFDGVALGDSINERRSLVPAKVTAANNNVATSPRPDSFTHTTPAGWSVDNTTTPGLGDDNVGVFEWEGWSFTTPEFWQFAELSGRQNFTKGTGVFAVADGDEWDDLGNPDGLGALNTLMETPVVAVPALAPGELMAVKFDSSWRAEDAQTAVLMVSLDGGSPTELLRWESDDTSAFFHDDNTDETVLITFDPSGASTAQFSFQYTGTDDWWWAIDNVQIGVIPEPSTAVLIVFAAMAGVTRRRG
jgi:hypothetical protein